jgi:hypothetical protein
MQSVVKRVPTAEELETLRIYALWLLYGRAPGKCEPEDDGSYSLGEIGETRSDRGIDRPTPYSPGRVK